MEKENDCKYGYDTLPQISISKDEKTVGETAITDLINKSRKRRLTRLAIRHNEDVEDHREKIVTFFDAVNAVSRLCKTKAKIDVTGPPKKV